jgi:hypothetical protein
LTESESEEYNISIGDNLKTNFTRHGDLVQIILNNDQIVYFNIHPKELLKTMDRFRESALNGTATLSKDTISKLERVLVNRANGYVASVELMT